MPFSRKPGFLFKPGPLLLLLAMLLFVIQLPDPIPVVGIAGPGNQQDEEDQQYSTHASAEPHHSIVVWG